MTERDGLRSWTDKAYLTAVFREDCVLYRDIGTGRLLDGPYGAAVLASFLNSAMSQDYVPWPLCNI